MNFFTMIDSGRPILNGVATVNNGTVGVPQRHDDTSRSQHIPSGDFTGMAQEVRLNTAYIFHGGPGGSGNWEH